MQTADTFQKKQNILNKEEKQKKQIQLNTVQPQQIAIINPDLTYDQNELETVGYFKQASQVLETRNLLSTNLTDLDKLYRIKRRDEFTHQLLQMVHNAYYNHYPLSFSPDNIQLLISQGFSAHIKMNAEKFRKKFVQHEGKKELVVKLPLVSISQVEWPKVIGQFCSQIKDNIGEDKYNLCVHQYSTTDEIAKVCQAVSLMDTMQQYFEYTMQIACGISKVKLLGTLEDWIKIRENIEKLREFELDWWIDKIAPVLDQFIKLYNGEIDKNFWGDIYKFQQNKGFYDRTPEYATGWITYFFPYRVNENSPRKDIQFMRNDFSNKDQKYIKLIAKQIPTGISQVPVLIKNDTDKNIMNVKFNAGYLGVGLDQEGFLNVKQGWAITQ